MAVDYDLVVIGDSPEGIYAAIAAANLKARVALVEQPLEKHPRGSEAVYRHTLAHAARLHKERQGFLFGGSLNDARQAEAHEQLMARVKSWAEAVSFNQSAENSAAFLAASGVDFISGAGEFCRPEQGFMVQNRRLRSRRYLIATGSSPRIPAIEGLRATGYLEASHWQDSQSLPQTLIIIGGDPTSVQLAQSLTRLGKNVVLVVEDKRLLPYEDREASKLIQAQLEAEGVRIFTASPVVQVKQIDDKKWVQAGNQAIEADEIVLATHQPALEGLNLAGVGVKWGERGVVVNRHLQTTNPRIYACGDVLGGYPFAHIAQAEARVALKNALFFPVAQVDYRLLPWVIFTDPPLARVGLTEAQARRYGDVLVVQRYFKSVAEAQIRDQTTGLCKLVVLPSGEILGAHIVGSEAGELISAIALAMKHHVKLEGLTQAYPAFTLSEIISQTVGQWQRDRLLLNKPLRNFLESLFILRRRWTRSD